MRRLLLLITSLSAFALATRAADSPAGVPAAGTPPRNTPPRFELRSGDRVVLLGDTFIEREGSYGYIEARLTSEFPNADVTFRNLGWSADTPLGQSRVSFDWSKPESEWFRQLKAQIAVVRPTVAILGYGMAASFAGEAGLEKFLTDLNALMDAVRDAAPEKSVRFIVLGPVRHENLGAPLPDPAPHNAQLARYTAALRELAGKRDARFIPLMDLLPDGAAEKPPHPMTDNGIHLTAYGYRRAAEVIARGLGWQHNHWALSITENGSVRVGSFGLSATNVVRSRNRVAFSGTPERLESPPLPTGTPRRRVALDALVQFLGLEAGRYTLLIDGQPSVTFSHGEWRKAQSVTNGPLVERAEKLRETIVKKNELFFHRWRPQNQTYLFGFRKHEQGQNAREIPEFDPLVAEQEKIIAELRRPATHKFELVPAAQVNVPAAAPKPAHVSTISPPANPQTLPTFEVAPGFEVNLFAESPQLAKPIQMNFDPQGRLWIASSEVYPQIKPGQPANDKILVIEDTDADGRADKSTVFADGLLIPTGIEPGDGGVYVGASTELLHFKDTDGDGRADRRRVVLSGFGTEDTHHILHTLRWGHDGQLYFNQSIYIHSHIETPHGVQRLNSGGVWHLRTGTQELGVFLKGFCNPWGHHFDAFGQSFVTDGAGFQGITWGVEGATYFTYADLRREMKSVSAGSYPKYCGIEVIESSHFPDDWQGDIVTPDFRAHRIVRFDINELGAGYATKEMPDLLRTTNVTFRPIDVKLGPDGALYIADWSNPIIQHGEVDFRDPRRDHEHGRIWRVSAKGRPLVVKKNFPTLGNTELLDQLLSPNNFDRQRARRVLTERGPDKVKSDLAAWAKSHADEKASLEALWMFQSLDVPEPALLERVLAAKDGRMRAAAVRVLRYWQPRLSNALDLLTRAVADEHPRVRVEAVRAWSAAPSARAAELVLSALDKPMDEFLDYAVWLSINDLAEPWIAAVQSGAWKIGGRERQLEFALQAIQPRLAAPLLARLLESKPLPRDGAGPWIELIGKAGSDKELNLLLGAVTQQKLDETATARALNALQHAARARKLRPAGDLGGIAPLLGSARPEVREAAARATGAWKLEALAPALLERAQDAEPRVRAAAFESLSDLGGETVFTRLQQVATQNGEFTVRRQAAQTLAALDLKRALPATFEVLGSAKDESAAVDLWRALLATKGAAKTITTSLPKSGFSAIAARAGMRVAREGGRNEPELVLALARAGGLEDDAKNLSPAEIQQMVTSVRQSGDAARGELIYRRLEMACVACHSIGGVGGKVGPDMTSIGASAPVDYLIESLLYPNRKIKEGYHSVVVETKDGQEISGVIVRENGEQLVLRDATNREIPVAKADIAKRAQGSSLMPSGLLDALPTSEQLDLVRFLSELGKPGPFDASKNNVARFWRVRPAVHTDEQIGDAKLLAAGIGGNDWHAVNSFVDGRVTAEMLREGAPPSRYVGFTGIYAGARFEVSKAGTVRLRLGEAPHLGAWIDGKPAVLSNLVTAELPAGVHTLVVKLDPRKLPEHLRLETSDATFLTN